MLSKAKNEISPKLMQEEIEEICQQLNFQQANAQRSELMVVDGQDATGPIQFNKPKQAANQEKQDSVSPVGLGKMIE